MTGAQPWHFPAWQRRASVLIVFPYRMALITATVARSTCRIGGALWRCEVAAEVAAARRWWRGR